MDYVLSFSSVVQFELLMSNEGSWHTIGILNAGEFKREAYTKLKGLWDFFHVYIQERCLVYTCKYYA